MMSEAKDYFDSEIENKALDMAYWAKSRRLRTWSNMMDRMNANSDLLRELPVTLTMSSDRTLSPVSYDATDNTLPLKGGGYLRFEVVKRAFSVPSDKKELVMKKVHMSVSSFDAHGERETFQGLQLDDGKVTLLGRDVFRDKTAREEAKQGGMLLSMLDPQKDLDFEKLVQPAPLQQKLLAALQVTMPQK